jgi:hypothetical protein
MRRSAALVSSGVVLALVSGPALAAQPRIKIPGPLDGPLPQFTGATVKPRPLKDRPAAPNQDLARNGRSGSGLAAGNGGYSPMPGPLGRGTSRVSALEFGTCSALALGGGGQLIAACNGPLGPSLRMIDPDTLETIDTLALPARPNANRTDLAGGTHFIARADGSLLVPANDRTLRTVETGPLSLTDVGKIPLAGVLAPGERPFAVAAGFDGLDWVAGDKGTVVTVPRFGEPPQSVALDEPVAEDIATDPSGTYVVTTKALYRIRADERDRPRVVWRRPVSSGPVDRHAGRIHRGSGTPPVIVDRRYVAGGDGMNPPHIQVHAIADGGLHCSQPVFQSRGGSIEAQLVTAGRRLVAANAYGYDGLITTEGGGTTDGGLEQIRVTRRGCRQAWTSDLVSPSSQAVVSRETGLLYTMEKPQGFPDAWNLAALDWRTGRFRFSALAGEGLGYNSEGGAVVLAPDGAAFAGSFGGVTRFADRDGR